MALPNATAVAERWAQRTSAASADYAAGVANTEKDPTALAIQAGTRYRDNVLAAFNSGKWANGLRRSGQQGWKAAVAAKGESNFANGVNAAQGKVEAAFVPLLAYEATLQSQVRGMPNVTDADRENRMLTWTRSMRKYRKP